MVCKKCRFDFCWVCLGPWEPHGSSWFVLSSLNFSSILFQCVCLCYIEHFYLQFPVVCRYNCNRFDEDDAKKARDAQEVSQCIGVPHLMWSDVVLICIFCSQYCC